MKGKNTMKRIEEMNEKEKREELIKRIDVILNDAATNIIVLVWELLLRLK